MPPPAGLEAVLDRQGLVRGYISSDTDRYATLEIGTGEHVVEGFEVVDADDELVGYMLVDVGFIDLATGRDPQRVDALVEEGLRLRGAATGD